MADRRTVAHSSLTAQQRSQRARVAALARHKRTDGAVATEAARQAFRDRFATEVDPDGSLSAAERERRAELALREHMTRLAMSRQAKAS